LGDELKIGPAPLRIGGLLERGKERVHHLRGIVPIPIGAEHPC
jgi:hypothetical protein